MERIARFFGVTRDNRLGFTLVELMIVIAIIGILAAISVPMYLGQRKKAIISEAESTLMVIFSLQEQYYAENGRYAPWPNQADPNSVVNYPYKGTAAQDGGIEDVFPQFKPGPITDLKFDYYVASKGTGGQQWHAAAVGKSGTAVAGTTIWLNYQNTWEQLK